jgi:tryptophan synthase beta subunit
MSPWLNTAIGWPADRLGEQPHHHVGPPPRAIDGEEAQARQRQAVEMGVGFAHQFVGLLGGGVEADGLVHPVFHREGQLGVAAIDAGGGGIDHVFHAAVAGHFQQVEVPGQVGMQIGVRMRDRIAHPGLRPQMHDARKLGRFQ